MIATHQHAEGGLYRLYATGIEGKDDYEGLESNAPGWTEGVLYQCVESSKIYWTSLTRWQKRFTELDWQEVGDVVETVEVEGESIDFMFKVKQAGELRHMLILAGAQRGSNLSKEWLDWMKRVLCGMSEAATQELHVLDLGDLRDMMQDIEEFHQKFGLEYVGKPRSLASVIEHDKDGTEKTLFDFRFNFMHEELSEYQEVQEKLTEKIEDDDHGGITKYLELQLDALCDLTYVVLGTAYLQFGPSIFKEAWRRVHRANMAKVRASSGEDDRSKRSSSFDVVKPKGWEAPDHTDLVDDHAHQLEEPSPTPAIETNTFNQDVPQGYSDTRSV